MVGGVDKLSLYQRSDVFVMLSAHENFSLVILEAMCCGTPVVTTRATAIWPDLRASGGALIVDDDRQLDEAVFSIALDRARRREMSEKARSWALKYVDTETVLSRYEAMYSELISARAARTP